jgi:hypothetical protein
MEKKPKNKANLELKSYSLADGGGALTILFTRQVWKLLLWTHATATREFRPPGRVEISCSHFESPQLTTKRAMVNTTSSGIATGLGVETRWRKKVLVSECTRLVQARPDIHHNDDSIHSRRRCRETNSDTYNSNICIPTLE